MDTLLVYPVQDTGNTKLGESWGVGNSKKPGHNESPVRDWLAKKLEGELC